MPKNTITTIFWNTWFYAQNGRYDDGTKLIKRLERLISTHGPDVFGLNEVLVSQHDGSSALISFLKKQNYYCHFAAISPTDDDWLVGNLMATKQKPLAISDHVLGPDTQAARRGYKGCTVKAISADLKYGPTVIKVAVNYMCSLLPADWRTHKTHRKSYDKFVSEIGNKNLIIGGDFNEVKYMMPWRSLPEHMQRKTGSLLNPTWRLNGKKRYLGFANYDNVVYSKQGNLKLHKFKVLDRSPSDHSPLLAIFEIN